MAGLTIDNPVTFTQALNSRRIIPGDVIALRAGTYTGDWVANIGGLDGKPVIIKPYNREDVTIDGSFTFSQPYLEIHDFEITDSNPDRDAIRNTITMQLPGCQLVGCHIHDLHGTGVSWFGSGTGGVVECWIHDNGYLDAENVGHGYAIYTHNNQGGARLIARNLFGNQYGKYTMHLYATDNYIRDYTCEDNVIFGDAVHTGGGMGLINFIYQRNIQFFDYCQHGRYTKDIGQNVDGWILDNLYAGLYMYSINANSLQPWLNLTESGNIVWTINGYGEPADRAGYTADRTPARWSKFIPFSLSERWSGIQADLVDGVFSAVMVER